MSKFVTVKTEVKDRAVLEQTLTELGYQFETGEKLPVRGYGGSVRGQAEVVIKKETTQFYGDVGFARNAQTQAHDVLMDDMDQRRFLPEFTQRYSRNVITKTVKAQGFRVSREEKQTDGSVRMVVTRFA